MTAINFFDDHIREALTRDGIAQVSLLDSAEVKALIGTYNASPLAEGDMAFHSTMYASSAQYRKDISDKIKAIIKEKIDGLMSGYHILFANFIVKEAHASSNVGIHQDWHFTSPGITSINVWIPLVDIDNTTGLFYALTGSHRSFDNLRYTPYEGDRYSALEPFILLHSSAYTVSAGEALIYDGAIVHYSDPNLSADKRIAIALVMIPADAPNVHYYKPHPDRPEVEAYAVDEAFYHSFDFFKAPEVVKKIGELTDYKPVPSLSYLKMIYEPHI